MRRFRARIGISGWRYAPWRGDFYPRGLAQDRELGFASRALDTIEINGTFYSLQRPESFTRWHRETPPGFVFAVKGSRYITHILRLREVETALANFLASGLLNLREKLGPMLWQFPPNFQYDEARFAGFLELLPRDTMAASQLARQRDARLRGRARLATDAKRPIRHAVEIRHESFANPAFYRLLKRHGVALVVADTAGKWPYLEKQTADFMYLRLHGDEELYVNGYTLRALGRWAKRIRRWRRSGDVYCYLDNSVKTRAPFDARELALRVGA